MAKKLLYKTSTAYLLYAALVLLIAAPVFYMATKRLYIHEADETLRLHAKEFLAAPPLQKDEVALFNKYNRNVQLDSLHVVVKEILFDTTYYDSLDAEWEPYRQLSTPVFIENRKYTYHERTSLVETADWIRNTVYVFVTVLLILLAGLFFITQYFSRRLWRPFNATLSKLEAFQLDRQETPVFAASGVEEFNRLNATVHKLIQRNKAVYKSQKEFVENAAHELQTPLAVFQSTVDSMMQAPGLTQETAEGLSRLNTHILKLNRLHKNLLLLAQMENKGYGEQQSFSLNELLKKLVAFFEGMTAEKNIKLTIDLQDEQTVNANPALAEILFSNLLLNAIRHNLAGGQVSLKLIHRKVIIENTSEQTAIDKEKMFNRFNKGNPSTIGTGLGLSIVKKIADINGWNIQYEWKDGLHSFAVFV